MIALQLQISPPPLHTAGINSQSCSVVLIASVWIFLKSLTKNFQTHTISMERRRRRKKLLHFYTKSFANVPNLLYLAEFRMITSISSYRKCNQCHVSFRDFKNLYNQTNLVMRSRNYCSFFVLFCFIHYTVKSYEQRGIPLGRLCRLIVVSTNREQRTISVK